MGRGPGGLARGSKLIVLVASFVLALGASRHGGKR